MAQQTLFVSRQNKQTSKDNVALQHDSVPLTQEDYYFMHFLMFMVQPAVQKETLLLLLMCKKKKKKRESEKEKERKKEKLCTLQLLPRAAQTGGPSVTVRKPQLLLCSADGKMDAMKKR